MTKPQNKSGMLNNLRSVVYLVVTSLVIPAIVGYASASYQASHLNVDEVVKNFLVDIERIKTLAPFSAAISDCLWSNRELEAGEDFYVCRQKSVVAENDPITLLSRNMSAVKVYLGDKTLKRMEGNISSAKKTMIELQNRYFLLREWLNNGKCSDYVDVLDPTSWSEVSVEAKKGCMLGIEDSEDTHLYFLNWACPTCREVTSFENEEDRVIKIESLKIVVVEGTNTTISDYFNDTGRKLEVSLTCDLDNIIKILEEKSNRGLRRFFID